MKAEELMINDWYMNSANEPCKVTKNFGDTVWGEGNDVADSTDNPLPILLTEEMLKANGLMFGRNTIEEDTFIHIDYPQTLIDDILALDRGIFRILFNHKECFCYEGLHLYLKFQYVHELQHALRLCGLTELADNFKV